MASVKQDQGRLAGFLHALRRVCVLAAFRAGSGVRRLLRYSFYGLLCAYFLFASLLLVLRFFVLPQVENYREEISAFIAKELGRPVKIAKIQASWQGVNPLISLRDFQILDAKGVSELTLPQLHARVSWWSLFALDVRFAELEFHQARLALQRDREGKWLIAGFPMDPKVSSHESDRWMDWLFSQHEIRVIDGQVVWRDELLQNPDLVFENVQLTLQNRWRRHQFAFRTTPPNQLSAPIDIRGDFKEAHFSLKHWDWRTWTGDLYADLKQTNLPMLHRYLALPFQLEKGRGQLRSWLKIDHARVVDMTADLSLVDVLGKFRKDLPQLDMAQISGRIIASEYQPKLRKLFSKTPRQAGHVLELQDFSMQTRDGLKLPSTSFRERFLPAQDGQEEVVELYAQSVDLHSLANFAEHLPLPADQRRLLIEVAPRGVLKDFSASWQGRFPEVSRYHFQGQFSKLEMRPQKAQLARAKTAHSAAKAAMPAIPGFENLSGHIVANEKGGRLVLDSHDLLLQTPSYFVDPVMPFQRLTMRADWKLSQDNMLQFHVADMEFQQELSKGRLSGTHRLSLQSPETGDLGELDVEAELKQFDVKKITRYIPSHTPDALRHWLSFALLDGEASQVRMRLRGALKDFPFYPQAGKAASQDGEFSVKGEIRNGRLNYLPEVYAKDAASPYWPLLEKIQGRFVFDRARMEIFADTAQTQGVSLHKIKAVIPDLGDPQATLQIEGNATGSLQSMLNYVSASPVEDWLDGFLHESQAKGNANLNLKLNLPLHTLKDSKVNGVLQLNQVETRLQADLPKLSALTGQIIFNEHGFHLSQVKANALGGPVTASGGTQKDHVTQIKLEGIASANGLRQHFPQPEWQGALSLLDGETAYHAHINVKSPHTDVLIESSLQGFASALPAPLMKAANESWPLRFEMQANPNIEGPDLHDQIRVRLGDKLQVHYQRQKTLGRQTMWRLNRGVVAMNTDPVLPEQGLAVHIRTPQFSFDDWRKLFGGQQEEVVTTFALSPELSQKPNAPELGALSALAAYWEPQVLSLVTQQLTVLGKKLENMVIGASRREGQWQANVDSKQVSGFISWNDLQDGKQAGKLNARLTRLAIPRSAASDVGDIFEAKQTAQHIPNLDVQVDQFELFDKKLGQLKLLANNSGVEHERAWQIEQLHLKSEEAQLHARGKWLLGATGHQTFITYEWQVSNAGRLLENLGFPGLVRAGKGKLEGAIDWKGLPFDLDMPSLNGDLKLRITNGQILKAETGTMKFLSLVTMQSLTRRLSLDFRDMFSEGVAFDTMTGDAKIKEGVISTDNFKMNSVNAVALMEGSADLGKETHDVHVALIPELNAGGVSVVYGLAVNPVIGLSTFLAQLFFRDPINRAFIYEYQSTGSLKNPVITAIANKEREKILEKRRLEQAKMEQAKAAQTTQNEQPK